MIEAVNAIQPSKLIKNIADLIIEKFFQNSHNYLALHWRYTDQDDASNSLKAICSAHPDRCDFYANLLANPDMVGQQLKLAVHNYCQKVLNINQLPESSKIIIYIATPTSNTNFINQVKTSFLKTLVSSNNQENYTYVLYTFDDILTRLKNENLICPQTQNLLDQHSSLQSNIEQTLCRKSRAFLFSFGSSWSLNVQLMRTAKAIVTPGFAGADDIVDIGVIDLIVSSMDSK